MRNINPGKFGAEFLLRDGADCPPDVCESHGEPEHERDCECSNKADYARDSEKGPPDVNGLERIRHIDGPGIGPECIQKRIFDDDSDAKSDEQHVAVIAMRSRTDDEALQGVADRKETGREQKDRNIWIEA